MPLHRYCCLIFIFLTFLNDLHGQNTEVLDALDTATIGKNLDILRSDIFTNPDSSALVLEEIIKKTEGTYYHSIYLDALNLLALSEMIQGNSKEALRYYLSALQKARRMNDSSRICITYNNVGDAYLSVRNLQIAYDYFRKSQIMSESLGDSITLAIVKHNIGRVLKYLGRYESAIKMLEESGKMSEKIGDEEGQAYMYRELGGIYLETGKYQKGKEYFIKAVSESKKFQTTDILGNSYLGLAESYFGVGKPDSAIFYFNKAIEFADSFENSNLKAEALNGLAHFKLVSRDLEKAKEYLLQIMELGNQVENSDEIVKMYKLLSRIEERKGNFKQSLENFKLAKQIEDSLNNSLRKVQIEQIQLEAELERKNFEISMLNNRAEERKADIEKQKFLRNVLAAILTLVAFLLFTVYRNSKKHVRLNRELTRNKEVIASKTEDLNNLNKFKDKFMSIIAHDLRSPLQSISGALYILEMEKDTSPEYKKLLEELKDKVDNTTHFLNNLLKWIMDQKDNIILKKEDIFLHDLIDKSVKLLDNYGGKGVTINNNVPRNITVYADENMMDLVIRNLIMNAIKFSYPNGTIEVYSEKVDKTIRVKIIDQGVGIADEDIQSLFDPEKNITKPGTNNERGSGLGLEFCKEFVTKNEGKIWVESKENSGTVVSFELPTTHF